jgi:hypothetical protein
MKELLRNKQGKIYDCTLNRANFNYFQMMRYVIWPALKYDIKTVPKELWEGLIKVGAVLLYIITLPILPFISAIVFKLAAKKEIARHEALKAKRE